MIDETKLTLAGAREASRLVPYPDKRFLASIAIAVGILLAPPSVSAERVIALSGDGVMRILKNPDCDQADCEWVDIDRNPRSIAVAATEQRIFQLHDTGWVWLWQGAACESGVCSSWRLIDNTANTVAIAANRTELFKLQSNGEIWRWQDSACVTGPCRSWERLDRNRRTKAIVAEGVQLYQLHDNGAVWRWKGAPCAGDSCGSWDLLDNNSVTVQITAGGDQLYQRHENGSVYRWDHQPCEGGACSSWTLIDRNARLVDIHAAPDNLYALQDNGDLRRWRGRNCEGQSCPSWETIDRNPDLLAIAAGAQPRAGSFSSVTDRITPVYELREGGMVFRMTEDGACSPQECAPWRRLENGGAFTRVGTERGGLYVFESNKEGLVAIPPRQGDRDGDGLPDAWEEDPAQSHLGLRTDTADMVVYVILRPGVLQTDALREIETTKDFFGAVPVVTDAGVLGIHLVVVWADETAPASETDEMVFDTRVPDEYVGYARTLLIGGGQGGHARVCSVAAGVSANWRVIVHELGHQLCLNHTPPAGGQSPIYASLMNYDYDYNFNGDSDALRFSDGKFSSVELDELSLNERFPFPVEDIEFLSASPYFYDLQPAGDLVSSCIDFNRNGVSCETGVKADINDGTSLLMGPGGHYWNDYRPNLTTGDVALAALGDKLVSFYTHVPGASQREYKGAGASDDTPARLTYVVSQGRTPGGDDARTVLASGEITPDRPFMTGAPQAVAVGNKIIIAYPVGAAIVYGSYALDEDNQLQQESTSFFSVPRGTHISLMQTNSWTETVAFLWNENSKEIHTRRMRLTLPGIEVGPAMLLAKAVGGDTNLTRPLLSNFLPAATVNTRTNNIVLLTGATGTEDADRLVMVTLDEQATEGRYIGMTSRWVTNDQNMRTRDRPVIVFDDRPGGGPHGKYLIYYRAISNPEQDDNRSVVRYVRVLPPNTVDQTAGSPFVTRERIVSDEYGKTWNPPAVVPYRGDFAYLYRLAKTTSVVEANNRGEIWFNASGEFSREMTDFDDLTKIATSGLRQGLETARANN